MSEKRNQNANSTGVVNPVYSFNSKKFNPGDKNYQIDASNSNFDLEINNVKLQIGSNVKDIIVTTQGVNIVFK